VKQASLPQSAEMKPCTISFLVGIAISSCGWCADTALPDEPMGKQLEWAEAAPTDSERADRLEVFWREYLPQEDGGVSPDRIGYGDGSHVCAIVHCAWQLTRAYIAIGRKEKALAMVNWLAEHESKTGLAPVTKNAGQASTGQPATRPEPKSEGGDKPQPEAEGLSR
jgi:hypothetical protein